MEVPSFRQFRQAAREQFGAEWERVPADEALDKMTLDPDLVGLVQAIRNKARGLLEDAEHLSYVILILHRRVRVQQIIAPQQLDAFATQCSQAFLESMKILPKPDDSERD